MDVKLTELIAIGASVTANCVARLQHHVAKAREAGVDESTIQEAVQVGQMIRQGASARLDKDAVTFLKMT